MEPIRLSRFEVERVWRLAEKLFGDPNELATTTARGTRPRWTLDDAFAEALAQYVDVRRTLGGNGLSVEIEQTPMVALVDENGDLLIEHLPDDATPDDSR